MQCLEVNVDNKLNEIDDKFEEVNKYHYTRTEIESLLEEQSK